MSIPIAQGNPGDVLVFLCPLVGFIIVPATLAAWWWALRRPRLGTALKWVALIAMTLVFAAWLGLLISALDQPSAEQYEFAETVSELSEVKALDQFDLHFDYKINSETNGPEIVVDGTISTTHQPFHERFRETANDPQVWQPTSGRWIALDQWRKAQSPPVVTSTTSRP